MIGLTFLLVDNQKHPNGCEILLESYYDCTSSGHEAEVAEKIALAALKALRLEQSVCVLREGSRTTMKGKLSLYNAEVGTPISMLTKALPWFSSE
jgi:hypothetical protein